MKKYLMGMIAVILAIGFSAFTSGNTQKASFTGEKWFHFDGTAPGDLGDASTYSLDNSVMAPAICQSTSKTYRCEILAVPQSGNTSLPNLSTIILETKRDIP